MTHVTLWWDVRDSGYQKLGGKSPGGCLTPHHHMPANRDAMRHAGTDAETQATCLDARGASDTGMLSACRQDVQIQNSLMLINCQSLQIHSCRSYSQILQFIFFIFQHFAVLFIVSCGVLQFSGIPNASASNTAAVSVVSRGHGVEHC